MPELFTIGHSAHPWERFRELLWKHRIEVVADVRSSPYSPRLPHFNREVLERGLQEVGLRYAFLGQELGARRAERECYVASVARYEQIARLSAFRAGLERVRSESQRLRLALLCAEKDPLQCHRAILVCRHLRGDTDIQHILEDGALESRADAERRLMAEEGVPEQDLFESFDALLARAYDQRGEAIAYRECGEAAASF